MRAKEFLYESITDIPGFKHGVLSLDGGRGQFGPLTVVYAPSIRGVTFWINRQPVGAIKGRNGDIPNNAAPYPVMLHGAKFIWYGMPDTAFDDKEKFISKKLPGSTFVKPTVVTHKVFAELLSSAIQDEQI